MKKIVALLIIRLLLSASTLAVQPPGKEPIVLEALQNIRSKQESEENVYRVIQQPLPMQGGTLCSPDEMARQRLREVGNAAEQGDGVVNVEAGHGEINVESNEGNIDSNVNIQILNQNERKCF